MKKKKIYNLKTLVSVDIYDRRIETKFQYQEARSGWLFGRKAGFTWPIDSSVFTKEDIESGDLHNTKMIVDGKKVYYQPKVILTFADGQVFKKEFPNFSEAEKFGEYMASRHIKYEDQYHVELP